MNLMQKIKDLQLAARKAGKSTPAALYTTLLGEAAMIGKNDGNRETTDAEVTAVVKKFVKNIDETIAAITRNNGDASRLQVERQLLEALLPTQLTEDELTQHVIAIVAGLQSTGVDNPKMGDVMKVLKQRFDGQYDGKLASNIIKSYV